MAWGRVTNVGIQSRSKRRSCFWNMNEKRPLQGMLSPSSSKAVNQERSARIVVESGQGFWEQCGNVLALQSIAVKEAQTGCGRRGRNRRDEKKEESIAQYSSTHGVRRSPGLREKADTE